MNTPFFYKSILIIIFGILQAAFLYAQEGHIKGRVRKGNEDLPNATVSLGTKTVLTDHKGQFSFSTRPGVFTLTITHTGYKKIEQAVKIEAGNTQTLDVNMAAVEQMGEVVVLGSRSVVERSNLNTPVPVDVFTANRLAETGQISLTQMLNVVAPSFNASRELLNEPVTLRGLDPQHVLILVNGTRYHNLAWLFQGGLRGQLGRGSVGNDLNSIPFSAIDKIEILRDGASAQYGSDAVAGVINIRLKETTGKTSVRLHGGRYYKGDGEKFSFGANHGVSLNQKGFLNISGDFRYQAPTFRGGEYTGTVYKNYPRNSSLNDSLRIQAQDDSMVKARGFNRWAVSDNNGSIKIVSAGLLVNGGYSIGDRTAAYWTAAASDRLVNRRAAYRFPKNPNQVNLALYPDGFGPISNTNTVDVSAIAGLKGELINNWQWNLSSSYGNNTLSNNPSNTNNASQSYLGKDAPTSFYGGGSAYQQLTNDLHFTKRFSPAQDRKRSWNLGWGGEWRVERFQTKAGEEPSWKNYDTSGRTQGGGGTSPEDVINKGRHVMGAYVDVEAEFRDRFLFDAAGRYEYYSDFGGNFAAKLATRYKLSDRFSLRASVNNGFRAPSLQQRYNSSTAVAYADRGGVQGPVIRGIFPNHHQVASALGVPSLTAERTINVSGGLTASMLHRISLTVDAYWIQIKNRVILSGTFSRATNRKLDSILSGYPHLKEIDEVAFFSNAINTRTKGADIVLNGHWSLHKSDLRITLAANVNQTKIFGVVQSAANLPADSLNTNTLFDRAERGSVEKGQPSDKIILSLIFKRGKMSFHLNNTRFGKTAVLNRTNNKLDEFFSPRILSDLSIGYTPRPWWTITLGANNVFNVYPDPLKHDQNTGQGIWIYSPEASPFGFNGGYYFIGTCFNW